MPVFVFRGGEGPTPDQGIGAGIIPELLDIPMLDRIMTVPSDEALERPSGWHLLRCCICCYSSGEPLGPS
jgi:cysteine synthase